MSFTSSGRDLAVVAAGRGLSMLGDELAVIALALWASRIGSGAAAVAALAMAAALPQLLAAPVAGMLVDRLPARRLIAAVSLLQGLVCVALVPAVAAGSLGAVLGLVVLLGLGQSTASPAWQALVPSIVDPARLSHALALVQGVTAGAALLGPAVGGVLVGTAGVTAALVIDAISFGVLAVAALALQHDRVPGPTAAAESGGMAAGIRVIAADPVLRGVLVLVTALVLAGGAINVAEILLVTRTLGAGPTAYGFVGAAFAAGLMAGAWLSRGERSVARAARLLVAVTLSMAACFVALGLAPTIVVAAVASCAIGLFNGMLNVLAQSVYVRRSPSVVRGRVFAALQGVIGAAMLLATALGGLLLGVVDVRVAIVGGGVLSVLVLVVVGRPLLVVPERDGGDGSYGDREIASATLGYAEGVDTVRSTRSTP
jgi:MFS family permease